MGEVIKLRDQKENWKRICTLTNPKLWEGESRFCWMHRWHDFLCHGAYTISSYTTMEADLTTKDILHIRDFAGHQWNFECPAELISRVTRILCDRPIWVKYLLKYGLDPDLALHLARRAMVDNQTLKKRIALEVKYARFIANIYYATREDGGYDWDPIKAAYRPNPETTPEQKAQMRVKIDEFFQPQFKELEQDHKARIHAQDLEYGRYKRLHTVRN